MAPNFASFTIITFFLFFAVSTARISLNPPATNLPAVQITNDESNIMKSLPGPEKIENSNIILPSEKSNSDETVQMTETKKDNKMNRVDLTPRSDFARFHAINRHFFDEPRTPLRSAHRRPSKHSVNPFSVPRSEISYRNEAPLFGETSEIDSKKFHRPAPLKRMKAKHDYGHRHQRHKYHHHLHRDNRDVSVQKHMFAREKLKDLVREHNEKKSQREHEASFMKGIRKFLKHTFD